MHAREFKYGKYCYEYELRKQKRKTLSLTVNPDQTIIVKAPYEADTQRIEDFLQRKWLWLQKQLRFFDKYKRKEYRKEYVSGEGFLYLGKQYTLQVQRGNENEVKLDRGKIKLVTTLKVRNSDHNKKILNKWYRERAKVKFTERFYEVLKNFDYKSHPELRIRKLSKRWGSYLQEGVVILNPELIKAPIECIDYVITHELCHVRYPGHTTEYWSFLETKFPNWQNTKEKLELLIG